MALRTCNFTNFLCIVGVPRPVAIYPMNAMHGTNDIGSYKLPPGTATEVKAAEGPDGKPGGSYYLSGAANSHVEIPRHVKLDTTFSITVMMWLKCHRGGSLFIFNHPTEWSTLLWISSSCSSLWWKLKERSSYTLKSSLSFSIKLSEWQHVSATYQYSSGVQRIWVNGQMAVEKSVGTFAISSNLAVKIGKADVDPHSRYFRGYVSCLQVFDIALRQEEIIGEMNRCFLPKGKGCITKFFFSKKKRHSDVSLGTLASSPPPPYFSVKKFKFR